MKANSATDTVWQSAALTNTYLDGVRGAIPFAAEQIEIMLRLIHAAQPRLTTFLDLGCGDGILGQAILDQYPDASGLFVDFSKPMLKAARNRLQDYSRCELVQLDYGKPGWQEKLPSTLSKFEVIVSGYSIHHQPDSRKQEIYRELFDLLVPGGLFLNLEHVSSPTPWVKQQFDELFINSLFVYHKRNRSQKSLEQVSQEFYNRPDKESNILAPVEEQCHWLRHIGFKHVDCYLKIFELALFGGIKPENKDQLKKED